MLYYLYIVAISASKINYSLRRLVIISDYSHLNMIYAPILCVFNTSKHAEGRIGL